MVNELSINYMEDQYRRAGADEAGHDKEQQKA
jgi:hypothetical protein